MLKSILMIISAALTIMILVQPNADASASNAFMGVSNPALFANKKERGILKKAQIATAVLVAAYMALVVFA